MKADNILHTIGNTPHVRINRLFGAGANVWIKSERSNPGGSIKDRIALAMARAMRSLIEPPGLLRSDLIHTFAPAPNRRLMRTCGVLPMVWRMLSAFMECSC